MNKPLRVFPPRPFLRRFSCQVIQKQWSIHRALRHSLEGAAAFLILFVLVSWLFPVGVFANSYQHRPWWTERSAFVEGDTLYAVGVASNAKTVEQGRQQAFERGAAELANYAQVTSLQAHGLVIETQMTYEEPNQDGTVTVFRLLKVPAAKLHAVQSQLHNQSKVQEQELTRLRQELEARRVALSQKEQEAEAVLQTLRSQLGKQQAKSDGEVVETPVGQRLKEASLQVEKRTADIEAIIHSAQERHVRAAEEQKKLVVRIEEERKELCGRAVLGMTSEEAAVLLGKPSSIVGTLYYYGREKQLLVLFDAQRGEASYIGRCMPEELRGAKQYSQMNPGVPHKTTR